MPDAEKKPRLLLGAESLVAGNGGICRVARLIGKVVDEQVGVGLLEADAITLSDRNGACDLGFPTTTASGSRQRFVLAVCRSAFTHSHFIYDFVGIRRAHCRFPLLRRPFMTYIHGIEVWEGTRRDRVLWAQRANLLLSNTAYTRERANRLYGGLSKARVCWLATEEDEVPENTPVKTYPPTVLIVARMDDSAYKGHDELIDCWPAVTDAVPDAILKIVGSGPGESRLRKKSAQSSAAHRIQFAGFVPENQMEAIWSEAAVFAMPSRGEGFGLVYIEAMRHAIPVIASVHDAGPEINIEGNTGYNVDLQCGNELTARLIDLLRNRDVAADMGMRGRTRWREHFRYSAFKKRFVPLLGEFLAMK